MAECVRAGRIFAVVAQCLLLVIGGDFVDRQPFPLKRMERLTVGMSTAEVRAVLGEPSARYSASREPTSSEPFDWATTGF